MSSKDLKIRFDSQLGPPLSQHDWNNSRRPLCREDRRSQVRDDHIDLEPQKLGRDLAEPLVMSVRPKRYSIATHAAFDPPELASAVAPEQ
jgi:hypothetical protein